MSVYKSSDVGFMLLNGYSILGSSTKIDESTELKLSDVTALGQSSESWDSSGTKKTVVTQEGYFDDASNGIHEALKSLPDGAAVMSIAPAGNTNASRVECYQSVYRVAYGVQLNVGEVHRARAEYGAMYGKKAAYIVHALGTEGAAGNTDSLDIDLGTQPMTTDGGLVFLHVVGLSGCTSSTVTLRHSSDAITYADKQVCSAVTPSDVPENSGQYVAFSGTLNRYVSAAWSYASPSSPSITFMLAVYPA